MSILTRKLIKYDVAELFAATIIAMVGLYSNNEALIIAAMLISPMGGKLLQGTQRLLDNRTLRGFGVPLVHLILVFTAAAVARLTVFQSIDDTPEMESRYTWDTQREYTYIIAAVASLYLVYLELTGQKIGTGAVGFGIAISLLPPVVVSGTKLADGITGRDPQGYAKAGKALALYGVNSGAIVGISFVTLLAYRSLVLPITRTIARTVRRSVVRI